MRKLVFTIAALGALAWGGAAWAIVGDTSVTATDGGTAISGAKISVTFKTDSGQTIKKISTVNHHKIVIPNRTRKVDITVTVNRKEETRTDIDVGLLIGRDYVIEIPGGSGPPGAAVPGDPGGTLIGGGLGGRFTGCNDWSTTRFVTFDIADRVGEDADACFSSGVRGSLSIGTSMRVNPDWLLGVEADVGYANTRKTISGIPGSIAGVPNVTAAVAANDQTTVKETWDFSLRARFGRYVTPSTVVYGTAGLALQGVEATVNCTAAGACGVNGIPAFSATNSTTLIGWVVGVGIDTAINQDWVARGEYRYAGYGTYTATYGTPANFAVTSDIKLSTHTALIGVSYKLGR